MFRAWCRNEKFNNGKALSHVLMDGGCLSVPFERLDEFYDKYIEAVRAGEKLYVVEQKTDPAYNFFVDIDYKDVRALTIEEIEDVSKIICDKARSLGGKDAIVSVAPPKAASSNKVKTGIHINFPNFVVNQTSALAAREHVIVALCTAKGGMGVDWDKAIDQAVYGDVSGRKRSRGSGFRMPWSHKLAKHEACDGKGCDECAKGRTSEFAYLPMFRYRHGSVFTIMEKIEPYPSVDILRLTAVRSNAAQDSVTVVESPHHAIREGSFKDMEDLGGEEIDDVDIHEAVEKAIRSTLQGQVGASVKKIIKIEDTYLIASDSKYCENIERNHGSNHVYFVINNGTLRQKCHCKCETYVGRIHDLCKNFSGKPSVIAPGSALYEKLYPDGMTPTERTTRKKAEAKADADAKRKCELLVRTFPGHARTCITAMKKKANQKAWTVLTNSKYCSLILKNHEKCMQFIIQKGSGGRAFIHQECECTRSKDGKTRLTKVVIGDESLKRTLFRSQK